MRLQVTLLAALVLPFAGCVDEKLTLNEACVKDAQCLGDQVCAITPEEQINGLPGVCVEPGTPCLFGYQLGCACDDRDTPDVSDDFCDLAPDRYNVNQQFLLVCDQSTRICVQDFPDMGDTGN